MSATVGEPSQLSLLIRGNPLHFSVVSDPSSVSIDPQTGQVTYIPSAGDVGTVNITFAASNSLGSLTQTIQFNVGPAKPNEAAPAFILAATSAATYNSGYQSLAFTAVAADRKTPIAGSMTIAYNGVFTPRSMRERIRC